MEYFTIKRGDEWSKNVTLSYDSFDFSGIQIKSQLRESTESDNIIYEFAITPDTSVIGTCTFALTSSTSDLLKGIYCGDIEIYIAPVEAAAVALALVQLPEITIDLSGAEIFVNPGEFIAVAKKKIGTAPYVGVIAYTFTPIYNFE